MLDTLRRIVQEVNDAKDLSEALQIIVKRVKNSMAVDLCSVYLTDHPNHRNVLMATDGLNPASVGNVSLNFGEGITGLVGEKQEVVNIADAPSHPRYKYIPETGEEIFHSYLGVPIIHHRKLLGVLVVQRHESQTFDEDSVTFLITIAAQLSGAIAHAEASGGVSGVLEQTTLRSPTPFMGQPGAPGVGVGVAFVIYPSADLNAIPDRTIQDIAKEEHIFRQAVDGVKEEINSLMARLTGLPAEERALFDAYLLMLDNESLVGDVIERIRKGNWASGALRDTIRDHVRAFEAMEDQYLSERGEDIKDLGRRILVRLQSGGDAGPRNYPRNTVLVGSEITAAMLAEVPITQLAGVISVTGSRTSHVAILARAMGIAAVMGADIPVSRIDGLEIIVDGYRGQIYVSPNKMLLDQFNRLAKEEQELSADLASLWDLPSETPDGMHVPLHINSGLLADLIPKETNGAEGIGLYRTEFPFMIRDRFPGEEEQLQIYRQVLSSFKHGPITLRTLDVGGDKALPYFPIKEDNPFLGWRGIRITLDHPEIFLVQLRAMLRASEGLNNMQLLLPMINSVHEVDDSLIILKRAYEELLEEGYKIVMPKVGVMIEVPSAVYQVREIARRVEFLSVGTNDLTQYLLAVDRNNSRVAESYDALHPSVLRALVQIVEGAHQENRPVSVCGEMAGDPASAILLIGMGVDSLSMSVANLPRIKWVVRNFTSGRARRLLKEALTFETAQRIRDNLNVILEEAGLGGLVRAGR